MVVLRLFVIPVVGLASLQQLTSNTDRVAVVSSPVTLKYLLVVS